ncbi:MAG: phage terminase large subunit, partial [Bacteroidetes bacterium]|nr:phage terminase large subunit [Bacteroidota bacterium]
MNELSNSLSTLNVSPVFLKNYEAFNNPAYRIIANQGGTRSGKTYSITQLLIFLAIKEYYEISIVSKTLPHVKRGVLRDFKKEMQLQKIYNDNSFNKSDYIYNFKNNSSYIEFFSADSADKLAGPGRDILFINEINMLNYEEWIALALRTRKKIIIDYNPIDEFSFIYDKILTRDDCIFIQSNYLDNYDFLPEEQITFHY